MKSPAVDIWRPATLEEALAILSDEDDAQILAGGQSLVVSLNMRLSSPAILVDINHLPGLDGIVRDGDEIVIGPLVRHAGLGASALVAHDVPLLAGAISYVAHQAVRNRGTICGSLAYADPAGELPAAAVALDARLELQSVRGTRTIPARDFFLGLFETQCAADEMITAVRFPVARPDQVFSFDEVTRRHGDFAIVGMAARGRAEGGCLASLDLVVFASEPGPLLCRSLGPALAEGADAEALAELIAQEMTPMKNLQGTAATKRAQGRALAARMLTRMIDDCARG